MARTDDQSSPQDVPSSRRRVATKPEAYVAPVWPCKINGCGKTFVREADLKRHQRTTKTHSMPSFTCEECDASFTRTDALRRHQKSRHHVVRALSRNTNAFIEESGTTSGETKAASGSSERSTRSRSSRSLSPRPSQEKDKERREKDRKDRELPRLEDTGPSRYYRQHTAPATQYIPSPLTSIPPPPPRPQTHSSSLNAILASPISTPRLYPAKWTYPEAEQSTSQSGYAPPPPPPPPPVSHNGQYVPHYRYPDTTDMDLASPLLPPIQPTSSLRQPPSSDHRYTRRHEPRPISSTNKCGSSPTKETSLQSTPSPPPPPPIASTKTLSLSVSSASPDLDESDSDVEIDELLPSSPEPEAGSARPNSNKIPDIEACIDPATGITAEEVKAAMDAVLQTVQQEREQEQQQQQREQREQQQQQQQQQAEVDRNVVDPRGRVGVLGLGAGIGIRATSTADHNGSPFLSEIPSSSGVNRRAHAHDVHVRRGRRSVPELRRDPGTGSPRQSSPLGDREDEEVDDTHGSDMDESGNLKVYDVGARGLGKLKANGINELHDHDGDEYEPPSLGRSPSLLEHHHIVNEDGEDLLHPAELLTQESPAMPSLS